MPARDAASTDSQFVGHRCQRPAFGSPVYSKEELAAEFAATFLCNEAGVENTIENSTAYIQGWAKKLRKDKRLVVTAASQGQKAADYILDHQRNELAHAA